MKENILQSNIFFVGFMASGKSSLGKKLAAKLSFPFFDLDEEIEKVESSSINEIFKQKGEQYFRKVEIETLRKVIQEYSYNTVISLGGGTFCNQENVDFINKSGLTIYLDLELKNIIGRLKADKENRPLVKDLRDEDLQKSVKEIFEKRQSFYEQADFKIQAKKSKSKLIQEILNFISYQK